MTRDDLPRVWDVVGCLESHPSLTARHLAHRIACEVYRMDDLDSGLLRRLLRLTASWAAACWRDPHARHPHLLTYRTLDALGL